MAEEEDKRKDQGGDILTRIAEKVTKSENVLIALSKDPSVDELAAAIGLTMMLDGVGKHATAIFSGHVPNALEFLEPEKTLEKDTNSLQDFIIALNKEKADHLRYKIEGDYVKVFITPYKATIDEKDLEFSHGDFNVDLVIAIDVASTNDLDAALYEHGRIMHNASSINIAAGMPGSFGDLEWGDPGASSVSEMICELEVRLRGKEGKTLLTQATATAFLTGIVAATDRFLNEKTTPDAMVLAGKLMEAGADQQMISANIKAELGMVEEVPEGGGVVTEEDGGKLKVEKVEEATEGKALEQTVDELGGVEEKTLAPMADETILNVQKMGAVDFTADEVNSARDSSEKELEKMIEPPRIVSQATGPLMNELAGATNAVLEKKDYAEEMARELGQVESGEGEGDNSQQVQATVEPLVVSPVEAPIVAPVTENQVASVENPALRAAPVVVENVEQPVTTSMNYSQGPMGEMPAIVAPVPGGAPGPEPVALPNVEVQSQQMAEAPLAAELVPPPLPLPDEGVLPPPPPPFDPNQQLTSDMLPVMPQVAPIEPAAPVEEEGGRAYLGENPAMQDQVYPQGPQQSDPGAFVIPGA